MTEESRYTRRGYLAAACGVVGSGLASTGVSARTTSDTAQNRTTRQMVARESKLFENNYVGQFVIVADVKTKRASPNAVTTCEFPNWSANETWVYNGVFVDNIGKESTSQQSVRTDLYMDGSKGEIEIGQPFIINDMDLCPDGYVGLEAQSVPTYAANGQPVGPTVTESDDESDGSGGSNGSDES
ncbi:hypothetical protein [Haladaptatus sp. T7]|uniref:hypothetical protein n=1 Tax=Haladaptatus sp. T7 TaxID=2029368 RepID=UPI002232B9CF|nr:hypothetical protein [Haladaptatus sp. T7]